MIIDKTLIDKTLLFDACSIGRPFLDVKGYFATILHGNAGAGDAIGGGRWIGGRSFGKSAHFFVESPGKRAFMSTIQANLSCTPFFHDALCLNIGIPGVFGVAVDGISVCLKLEIASGAFMGRPIDRLAAGIIPP